MEYLVQQINMDVLKRAKNYGFMLPSNELVSKWLEVEANKINLKDYRIVCDSDYAFPKLVMNTSYCEYCEKENCGCNLMNP